MVRFRVPFVTLQNLSFSKFVALAVIPKSVESTRDTFESRFAFCYFFGVISFVISLVQKRVE